MVDTIAITATGKPTVTDGYKGSSHRLRRRSVRPSPEGERPHLMVAPLGFVRLSGSGWDWTSYPGFFSCATAASAAWKPILLWVPSQNGLVTDAPHRHSANRGPRALVSTLLPFTSTSSTSPSTRYGPFGRMLILTAIPIPPHRI